MSVKKRVLSGIQPTGSIHLGNYLGAVKNWVAAQDDFDNIFLVVDLHAITVKHDPALLRAQIRELSGILIAAGIDPEKSSLVVQSQVPQHAELAWILNCVAGMGQLERMTQYKEKSDALKEQATVGLFTYPLLMAADILVYRTDRVPVGADQKQHVELCRDLAQRFNAQFGETFTIPEPVIPAVGARVMGLDDPTKKMSKSATGPNHAIGVLESPSAIVKKLKRATTDSLASIRFDEERPGVNNLLGIYQALTGQTKEAIEVHFEGKMYGHLKQEVADVVVAALEPVQKRYAELARHPAELDAILARGAERARGIAEATLEDAKDKLGLG